MKVRAGKTNHKKGIKARMKLQRRQDAEERQANHLKIPIELRIKNAGKKERAKLESRISK